MQAAISAERGDSWSSLVSLFYFTSPEMGRPVRWPVGRVFGTRSHVAPVYPGSSQDCGGFGWEKGPDSTCYQFNTDQTKLWAGEWQAQRNKEDCGDRDGPDNDDNQDDNDNVDDNHDD